MPRSSFRTNRTNAAPDAGTISRAGCAAALVTAAALVAGACSGGKADPSTPVASLAQTREAQGAFQTIRARWVFATPAERASIEPQLRAFRERFAEDPLARVADAYLAFLALDQGRIDEARDFALAVATGPAGNTRDLAIVVQGALAVQAGEPERALQLLAPLEGKLLDEFAGALLHEAIVEAALQAHRWMPAARYMNDWLRDSNDAERAAIRARVGGQLTRFPPEALEDTLRIVQQDARPDAWEKDFREALALRLGQIAIERADARLARSVIQTSRSAGGLAGAGTELEALEALASLGARVPTVAGRIVGLVVPTAERNHRQRAADAIQGALAVFDPTSTSQTEQLPSLRMREAGGELEDVITSLDVLAQDGAAIAIAGFDPERASAAAGWAEAESMPVILLSSPSRLPEGARFVFVLGEDERSLDVSLTATARSLAPGEAARIVPAGRETTERAARCDAAASLAGDPRFPFRDWQTMRVSSIAVTGPAPCATDVLSELQAMNWRPLVVLGLPALGAARPPRYTGPVVQALAGRLGDTNGTARDHATLAAWRAEHGSSPGWYAALGRDAALLAALAVSVLPLDQTPDPDEVARRRSRVQQALLSVSTTLWTSDAEGFAGSRKLERTVRYERVGNP